VRGWRGRAGTGLTAACLDPDREAEQVRTEQSMR
jgi:hypothetical protein